MTARQSTRPKGSGSLRELRPGVWQLRVGLAPDPVTGKQRQASKTYRGPKSEAQKALAQLVAKTAGGRTTGNGISLERHLRDWMVRIEKDHSPTTVAEYWRILDAIWLPRLGHVALTDLKPKHIQAVLDAEHGRPNERDLAGRRARAARYAERTAALARAGTGSKRAAQIEAQLAMLQTQIDLDAGRPVKTVSAAAVMAMFKPLCRALNEAVQLELIDRSPADSRIIRPRNTGPIRDEPSEEEMVAILHAAMAMDPGLGMLLRVAAATGVRRGELCGCRWRDIDYDAHEVGVIKNVVIVRNRRRPEGDRRRRRRKVVVKDTKTHQQRGLDIDQGTALLLKAHHEYVKAAAVDAGTTLKRDAFVFSREPDGSQPLLPEWVTKAFKRAANAAGVPAHLHQMRHLSVQAQLDAGIPLAVVSQRAGHERQSTTINIYNRRTRTRSPEAAAVLGRMLDGPTMPALPSPTVRDE